MRVMGFLLCPNNNLSPDLLDEYNHNQRYHKMLLMKSMSGRRLHKAFGTAWFNHIFWDNANPQQNQVTSDHEHIKNRITSYRPNLVLTFGQIATSGVLAVRSSIESEFLSFDVMSCHHPNARYKTNIDLERFVEEVKQWIQRRQRS